MMRRIFALLSLLLAAASLAPLPRVARAQQQPSWVVIIGKSAGITDIALPTLRRAFLGEIAEYASGKRLIPFNAPTGAPGRVLFDKRVLGLAQDEVGRFWVDRRIRDEGAPPRTVPSAELAVRVVAAVPGAITYVPANLVIPGVQVLTIDKRAPGTQGYTLNP